MAGRLGRRLGQTSDLRLQGPVGILQTLGLRLARSRAEVLPPHLAIQKRRLLQLHDHCDPVFLLITQRGYLLLERTLRLRRIAQLQVDHMASLGRFGRGQTVMGLRHSSNARSARQPILYVLSCSCPSFLNYPEFSVHKSVNTGTRILPYCSQKCNTSLAENSARLAGKKKPAPPRHCAAVGQASLTTCSQNASAMPVNVV